MTGFRHRLVRARRLAGWALILVCGSCVSLHAQSLGVRSWHVDDGLPGGTITALAQTPDGFLWVGSPKGLVRFDGARFSRLTGLGNRKAGEFPVAALLGAADGSLWMASRSGLIGQMKGSHFRVRFVPPSVDSISSDPPAAGEPQWFACAPLAMDGEGTIWALGLESTLLRFRGNDAPTSVSLRGLPKGPVRGCYGDRSGRIWLLKGTAACVFLDGKWSSFPVDNLREDGWVVACPARQQGIWIGASGHGAFERCLRHRTPDGWEGSPVALLVEPGMEQTRLSAVLEDGEGRLWGSTWWGGVHVREAGGSWRKVQGQGPLAKCVVTCLFEDRQGAVWVGTVGEGLHQVVPQPVSMVLLPSEASGAFVTSVHAAHDGAIWMGTGGKGVYCWRAGQYSHFGASDGLPSEHISTIREDAETNLWAGTAEGLFVFRHSRFVPVAGKKLCALALCDDPAGGLWAGGGEGLIRFGVEGHRFEVVPPDGLPMDIRCLTVDRDGHVWVAAFGSGLWRVVGNRLVPADFQPRLGRSDVRSVLADAEGILWIGALYGGLFRWDGAALKRFTMSDGLPDDSIISLTADRDGFLWVSSHNGVFGFSRRRLGEYEPGRSPPLLCWRLGLAEGLANRGCSGGGQPVASVARDGRLWVANMVGAAAFDPRRIAQGHSEPRLLVEGLTGDGAQLTLEGDRYCAPASTRRFEFRYTAPDLAAPQTLRFRYRLEGLDVNWVEAGVSRAAVYSQLPAGDYRFCAMVGGNDGRWHESRQSTLLRVVPRFWELRWVQVLAGAALIGGLGAALARRQRRQLQLRLERLEMQHALEKERARIARDIHDDLGARLTEIVLMSDPEHPECGEPSRMRLQLRRISERARTVVQALNEIVWAVNPGNDNLPRLLDYLCAYSEELCESAGVRCWHDVPAGLPELPLKLECRHSLLLAVKEALNNALKHAAATEIWLRVTVEPGWARIEIEDNGCGFVAAEPQSLGNGLRHLRERLAELGGRAEVVSAPGRGTSVALLVPLKNRPGSNSGAC